MERNAFISELLKRAEARGVAGEVCVEAGESFEVSVKGGEIHQYSVSDSAGLGFRVLVDGHAGTASTQIMDGDALDQLLDGAIENAELVASADEQFMYAGDQSYPEMDLCDPAIGAMPASQKIEMAKELERLALAQDARIRQVEDCAVFTAVQSRALRNTLGLDVAMKTAVLGGYVCVVARDGEKVNTGMKVFFTLHPETVDLEAVARRAANEAINGLDGAPVASGKYRVLFRNDVAAALLATFAGVFSADNAQKGLSRLKDMEGETVAAGCVTLMDDPHRTDSAASAPFDGEGVATRKKAVIEGGKLNTLLHNLKTARKQGVETTANACRAAYGSSVGVAPTNFYFAPCGERFEGMVERVGDGLLITELQGMHAGANAVTGDFSLAAKGFMIEGGRVTRPVNQITVAGNFYEILKDVEAVGDDLEFRAPGVSCFGSGSLLVREVAVAGK